MNRSTAAYVNHGRWVAHCPAWPDGCRNAMKVRPVVDSVFACSSCGTVGEIVWPDDWADIEAVLALRPIPESRNWFVGETVDDLAAENAAHQIGVT